MKRRFTESHIIGFLRGTVASTDSLRALLLLERQARWPELLRGEPSGLPESPQREGKKLLAPWMPENEMTRDLPARSHLFGLENSRNFE